MTEKLLNNQNQDFFLQRTSIALLSDIRNVS